MATSQLLQLPNRLQMPNRLQRLLPINPTAQPLDALPNGGGSQGSGVVSPPPAAAPPSTVANPSFIRSSAVVYSMDSGVAVSAKDEQYQRECMATDCKLFSFEVKKSQCVCQSWRWL